MNPTESGEPGGSDEDDRLSMKSSVSMTNSQSHNYRLPTSDKTVFVATGRLVTPQLIRDLPVVGTETFQFLCSSNHIAGTF